MNDDISPVANDPSKIIPSTCAYCGVGCGVDIQVDQGKAIALSGSAEHPANQGRLCVKGTHLLDTIDSDNRLLAPEVDGQSVSWSTATTEVADRFNRIIKEHGKDAVAFYVSGQLLTEDYYVANKLMKGYIGTANIDTNSRLCMSSAVSAYKRAFGEDVVPCNYTDVEQTDLLVLLGSNAAWTHPVLFQRIERARLINPNFKVVVIDPRATATASSADLHLPIKPGTDAALYNGLLWYLVDKGIADFDYISANTKGFASTINAAKKWSIDKVADYCDIAKEAVFSFYQLFAASEKAISFYSMGINQSSSGVSKCHSIINVHLASGKIGKTGCGPFSITGQPNAMGGREVGGLANQLTAHLDIENEQHQELVQSYWQSPTIATAQGAKAVDMFEQIASGKIKAVWIMATNPVVSLPDSSKVREALAQCELVVVSDCVEKNDTLAFADIKLPATTWLEKDGTVTNSERRISRQRSAHLPTGLAKHDWEIISLVAQKMGFSGFDYQAPVDIFNEFAGLTGYKNADETERLLDISALSNLSPQQYSALPPMQWPINEQYPSGCSSVFHDGKFSTPSGKAQFVTVIPQLPEQKISTAFPFVLNSGRLRDQWHTMTRTGKSAVLNQHTSKPYLDINPLDAKSLMIEDHQIVSVLSAQGEIQVPARLTKQVRQGQCFIPIHWSRQFASNATVTTLYKNAVDPISGQPEAKHAGVAINKTSYAHFGEIYCAQDIALEESYWLKSSLNNCQYFQLASEQLLTPNEFKSKVTFTGEWISHSDSDSGNTQLICLQENRVVFVGLFGTKPPQESSQWVDELFSKALVSIDDIQQLLHLTVGEDMQSKQKICSCHQVAHGEIVDAISAGCHSVEALGKQLKCGTKCGSCKPELQSLIDDNKQPLNTIDIKVLENA